jgi:hypothetical protein
MAAGIGPVAASPKNPASAGPNAARDEILTPEFPEQAESSISAASERPPLRLRDAACVTPMNLCASVTIVFSS